MARSKSGGMSSPLTLRTIFIWVALCLLVASFFIFFSSPVSTTFLSITAFKEVPPPERSFLRSLEVFLSKYKRSDFGKTSSLEFVQDLDDIKLPQRNSGLPLKVYVYDMPAKFTYDLLQLFWDTYHETSNLTSNGSPVHRLIEQHSIDFWLYADLLAPEPERLIRTMQRVLNQNEADVFYIPFFTTISYFLLEKQQCKQLYQEALNWVTNQQAWKRSGGHDHLLPVHHPWSFKSRRRFMKSAIWLLPDLDSTGNWYKPGEVSLEKDVVLPYAPNVDICDLSCLTHSWSQRKTLLFFRGRIKRNAGGKIRNRLAAILEGEAGVIIEEGTIGDAGKQAAQHGMRSSIFCLSPAGDTPSSARLFDAIVSGCIPVVVSDELEPPFEGILDYRKFALFLSSFQALEKGWLVSFLRGMSSNRISEMQTHITRISKHFQYSSPAQVLGPEDLTWQMVSTSEVALFARCRRVYANAHTYHINSISNNSDCETFISADDLRINLWNLEISDQSFNIVDIKPANMEDLTEVITSAEFHPFHCNTLAYSSSKGTIRLIDMRQSACKAEAPGSRSFFTEIIASISDIKFARGGRYILSRDYMTLKLWDLNMESAPVASFKVHEYLRPKLCDLYENDSIFDKYECCLSGDGLHVATGSYSNLFRVFGVVAGSEESTTLEASKTPNRRLVQTPSKTSGHFVALAGRGRVRRGSESPGGEINGGAYDFTSKLLHLAWHPSASLIACAASNSLYMYYA